MNDVTPATTGASAHARRFIEQACVQAIRATPRLAAVADPEPERTAPLDIAITIYNNAAALSQCLDSLRPTLTDDDTVWLIDDASDEPAIGQVMRDFAAVHAHTRRIRMERNRGFVGAANEALSRSERDVVLLNSDTVVTSGWLEQLQASLDRNPRAGIACPISNRATLLSACPDPEIGDTEETARRAAETTTGDLCLPTAVGFCMLIRRALLQNIGLFSEAFAPGYGEENDFAMRAMAAGWDIVAADRACVFHESGGSFGSDRANALQIRHQARLDRIWPEYGPMVRAWWRDNPLRAKTEFLASPPDERPAVLHVLHRQYHVGGTERVTRTLVGALRDRYRQTLIYPGETLSGAADAELRALEPCRELMLNNRWIRPATRIGGHGADFTCPQTERLLARMIDGSGADIVHFHHMLHWDSLVLPALARSMGCRVVISVHDFWFNCPIHNQLEHATGQPCGVPHARDDDRCRACLAGHGFPAAPAGSPGRDDDKAPIGAFVRSRHALVGNMLQDADAVVVPSAFIRDKLLAAFSGLGDGKLIVQPHGVPEPQTRAEPPGRGQRVVAYFGGDLALKGAGIVLHLARALADADIVFRIHGRIRGFDASRIPSNVELRGYYNPGEIDRVMRDIDLALLPSFYEESFSMVASECWAHGVPVLASSRGALRERVLPDRNGWLVEEMTAAAWESALRDALAGDRLATCREALRALQTVTVEEAAAAHDTLYRRLLARHGAPARADNAIRGGDDAADTVLAGFKHKRAAFFATATVRPRQSHCLGIVRDHWGTAHYRVRYPLDDLGRSHTAREVRFHVVRDAGFDVTQTLQRGQTRHVAVQPFVSDEGVRLMERLHRIPGLAVTLVIDDLWTALRPDNPVRASLPQDLPERLQYLAALSHTLVLTNAALQEHLALEHKNTHIIDNALPDWVWNEHATPPRPRTTSRKPRLGWAGAPQHGADLAFLEPVVRATADEVDWVFLGMCPDGLAGLGVEAHRMVPFDQYLPKLAGLGLDLALAPLTRDPFNECKSHLKLLEFGALGIPAIAADMAAYQQAPVPVAAPDDADAWMAAIARLLGCEKDRMEHALTLQQWVRDHHLSHHRRAAWAAALGIDSHAAA